VQRCVAYKDSKRGRACAKGRDECGGQPISIKLSSSASVAYKESRVAYKSVQGEGELVQRPEMSVADSRSRSWEDDRPFCKEIDSR
jgi:hypothetical protein